MQAIAFQKKTVAKSISASAARKQPRRISWQEFQNRYIGKDSQFKYEWVNGMVEKTQYTMNPTQLYIQFNLQDFFMRLLSEGKVTGQLLGEPDLIFYEGHHRRPDMAWLTRAQVEHLGEEGAIEVPGFVIEVISNKDASAKVAEKMEDYRIAGVKVVWHIFPKIGIVHVYSGENLRHMTVCKGEELCSAAPSLPAFVLPAQEIFKKSVKTEE